MTYVFDLGESCSLEIRCWAADVDDELPVDFFSSSSSSSISIVEGTTRSVECVRCKVQLGARSKLFPCSIKPAGLFLLLKLKASPSASVIGKAISPLARRLPV